MERIRGQQAEEPASEGKEMKPAESTKQKRKVKPKQKPVPLTEIYSREPSGLFIIPDIPQGPYPGKRRKARRPKST